MLRRSRTLAPADTPFDHDGHCRTPDATPQWHEEDGTDRWERVCSCSTQYAYGRSDELGPDDRAAEPSWRAHEHDLDCSGRDLAAIVEVRPDPDGGWRSRCGLCNSISRYWWQPQYFDRDGDGEPVRMTRMGMIQLQYELAHQSFPVA
jgi:hypothetical protein